MLRRGKSGTQSAGALEVYRSVGWTTELYAFFRELAKPFDPNRHPAAPTAEEIHELFAVAAKYGYWLASREENAAIGLRMV